MTSTPRPAPMPAAGRRLTTSDFRLQPMSLATSLIGVGVGRPKGFSSTEPVDNAFLCGVFVTFGTHRRATSQARHSEFFAGRKEPWSECGGSRQWVSRFFLVYLLFLFLYFFLCFFGRICVPGYFKPPFRIFPGTVRVCQYIFFYYSCSFLPVRPPPPTGMPTQIQPR